MATPPPSSELIIEEPKRDTRGRRITNSQRKSEIVAGYESSGLTQREFARREGVNYHTLVAWLGQSRRVGGDAASVATTASERAVPRFAEASWPARAGSSRLEVVLSDGVTVRGEDPAELVILLRALMPRRPC